MSQENIIHQYPDFVQCIKSENYDEIRERAKDPLTLDLLHATMGISGESGELMDAFKKHLIYGKPLDTENIKEELGDLLWYMQVAARAVGSSLEEVMEMNKAKLEKRYHQGSYSNEQAINRADKADGE